MLALLITALLVPLVLAAPQATTRPDDATPTVARRSYQSGGMTCYWQCQAVTNDVDFGPVPLSRIESTGGTIRCIYTSDAACYYNPVTGAFIASDFVTDCAQPRALGPVCGSQPERGFRRRADGGEMGLELGHTRDEPAIAARQFDPRARAGASRSRPLRKAPTGEGEGESVSVSESETKGVF